MQLCYSVVIISHWPWALPHACSTKQEQCGYQLVFNQQGEWKPDQCGPSAGAAVQSHMWILHWAEAQLKLDSHGPFTLILAWILLAKRILLSRTTLQIFFPCWCCVLESPSSPLRKTAALPGTTLLNLKATHVWAAEILCVHLQTQWGTAQVISIGPWRTTKVSASVNAREANRILLGTNN